MKTVIITGASKGLGLAIAKGLLQSDYKVIGISRTIGNEFELLQKKYNDRMFFYAYDFSETSGIAALVKKIVMTHGKPYALINNAAIGLSGILATMHETDVHRLVQTNIVAPILLTKYISRAMLLNRQGRIINVSSIIGETGFNGLSVYGATKAALGGFTKSLSRELGKANITVNTLAPGYMETAMTTALEKEKLAAIVRRSPLGKLANTEDVASAALFLLSDGASSITGTTITVDAGSTA
jgi:3-oxoacyl-[acyl-carrier protein] reductase